MKNREQIKQILERNIGITETKERINLKAIAELNNVEYYHAIRDMYDMLRDLFATGGFQMSQLFSSTDFNNPMFKTTLTEIDPRLAGLTRIEYSKDDVYVLLEGEEYTLSGDMVGIMLSRYNTVYETNRLVEVIRRRDALDQEELDSLEGSEAEIWDLSGNFNLDIQNFTLIKYIHSIKVVDTKILNENGKPKEIKTEDMSGYSLSAKMQLLEKYLDTDTTNRLFQRLEEIRNQGRTTIEYTYKCVKCGEEAKTYLDPAMFVFVVLQSLVFKIGNQ